MSAPATAGTEAAIPRKSVRIRLLLTALIIAGSLYAAWVMASTATDGDVPNDFGQFFVAAQLLDDGRAADVYEVTQFRQAIEGSSAFSDDDLSSIDTLIRPFGYPPLLPQALQPLTRLDPAAASAVFLGAGAVLMAIGAYRIHSSLVAVLLLLVTFPAALAVDLGQNTLWSAAFLALGAAASVREKHRLAGCWWGLLVFKPQILVAVLVTMLVMGGRRRVSAAVAATTAAVTVAISVALDPSAWTAYLPHALALASTPDAVIDLLRVGAFDLGSMFTSNRLVGVAIGLVISALSLRWLRRRRSDADDRLAAALVVAIWITPWTLLYDWALLAVPGMIIVRSSRTARQIPLSQLGVWAAFVWTTNLSREIFRSIGSVGLDRLRPITLAGGLLMFLAIRGIPSSNPAIRHD